VAANTNLTRVTLGVPPLRAGQGRSFLWRRLHSLAGIFPVGAFLVEHFFSNAFATNGPNAYAEQVKVLTGLPFLVWIEAIFIWIPISFHSLYGFYIWYRGDSNVGAYPLSGKLVVCRTALDRRDYVCLHRVPHL
jgi:succinate dehydrogenase / fumarate reductase cytochrome b subunit